MYKTARQKYPKKNQKFPIKVMKHDQKLFI